MDCRGDGRGIAPTFRRLHLMHRDVGLWKSRRLPPLPGPNIPGMDIPDAYSYLRNPRPSPLLPQFVGNSLGLCLRKFSGFILILRYPYATFCDSSSYSSQNSRPILQFQESPQRNIACRFSKNRPREAGCGLVPVERAVVFVAEKAAGTWHGDFITNKISKSL